MNAKPLKLSSPHPSPPTWRSGGSATCQNRLRTPFGSTWRPRSRASWSSFSATRPRIAPPHPPGAATPTASAPSAWGAVWRMATCHPNSLARRPQGPEPLDPSLLRRPAARPAAQRLRLRRARPRVTGAEPQRRAPDSSGMAAGWRCRSLRGSGPWHDWRRGLGGNATAFNATSEAVAARFLRWRKGVGTSPVLSWPRKTPSPSSHPGQRGAIGF